MKQKRTMKFHKRKKINWYREAIRNPLRYSLLTKFRRNVPLRHTHIKIGKQPNLGLTLPPRYSQITHRRRHSLPETSNITSFFDNLPTPRRISRLPLFQSTPSRSPYFQSTPRKSVKISSPKFSISTSTDPDISFSEPGATASGNFSRSRNFLNRTLNSYREGIRNVRDRLRLSNIGLRRSSRIQNKRT